MKINKTILLLLLIASGAISCNKKTTATVSTAAFYDMPVKFIRHEASGFDYFQIFAKGVNKKECEENAKMQLMKELIYNGIRQGTNINPILNEPQTVQKFRNNESEFLTRLADNSSVIEISKTPNDNLKQSENKNTVYSMPVVLSINRVLFTNEVLTFIKNK